MADDPESDPTNSAAESDPATDPSDEGPGCLPAVLALLVLSGIVGLVTCAVGTWYIYQNREQIALRSIEGAFVPALEQSLLEPEEKANTIKLLQSFGEDIRRGEVESWQASGVMQRLTRLPIFQWGKIRAVESHVLANADAFEPDAAMQFVRIRRGVELDKITSIDFDHILQPVVEPDRSAAGNSLIDPLDSTLVVEVISRAKVAADRAGVVDQPKGDPTIDTLVRRQIDAGLKEGSF